MNFKTEMQIQLEMKHSLLEKQKKMYEDLSPETGKFFNFTLENELMDFAGKPGKVLRILHKF